VERQAKRKRVAAIKDGNCYIEGSDFPAICRVASAFDRVDTIAALRQRCERWIYTTCRFFALAHVERQRSGFFCYRAPRKIVILADLCES
jgi:hypothetical protein